MVQYPLALAVSLLAATLATAAPHVHRRPSSKIGGSKARVVRNMPAAAANPSVPWSFEEARSPLTQPKAPDVASSVRTFSGAQVNAIPFAQPAQALEIVPGLIVGN
jgi:hypothetical protein